MFARVILTSAALLTAGCMATSRSLQLSDGQPGYAIACPGMETDWDSCYSKAAALCPVAGYTVVDREERHGQRTSVGMAAVHAHPTVNRTMLIHCQETP